MHDVINSELIFGSEIAQNQRLYYHHAYFGPKLVVCAVFTKKELSVPNIAWLTEMRYS